MTSTYNYTEEAFLLSSLQEMVKVWASGSGKAGFNLSISDGLAELQLNFQLGHPSEAHFDLKNLPQCHQPPQQQVHQPLDEAFLPVRRRRRKGPTRRARDRVRAEEHQARTLAAAPAVILPFAGKILPVQPKLVPQEDFNSAASAGNPSAAAAVTPPAAGLPPAVRPGKPSSTPNQNHRRTVDINIAKKQLFVPPPEPIPPGGQLQVKRKHTS